MGRTLPKRPDLLSPEEEEEEAMTTETTTYFDFEGRGAMERCIQCAADWCTEHRVATMVIFSGTGEGPHYAATRLLPRAPYKGMRLVAVTPPHGRPYRLNPSDPSSPLVHSGIKPAMREELMALQVGVVSAHLPFKEMYDGKDRTSEWTRVSEAFGVLGGGFALCIQSVLLTCDTGLIPHGERVVALTADTAIEVRACRTESFLSPIEGLLVGHIICRPSRYNISKRIHETIAPRPQPEAVAIETAGRDIGAREPIALPAAPIAKSEKARKRAPKLAAPVAKRARGNK